MSATEKHVEEMFRGEGLGSLAAALAKAQGQLQTVAKGQEVEVTSKRTGGKYKYRYATLADVMEACRKPLSENGLAILQPITVKPGEVIVRTLLIHTSGQSVECDITIPVAERDAQGIGSAITYARRYGLSAMVGIVTDEDDDGAAATAAAPKRQDVKTPERSNVMPTQRSGVMAATQLLAKANPVLTKVPDAPVKEAAVDAIDGVPLQAMSDNQIVDRLLEATRWLEDHPKSPKADLMQAKVRALEAELGTRPQGP